MKKKNMRRIFNIVFLAWFLLTPVFWHFDLARGSLGFYDAFNMAPLALFHLVVFYILALISLVFKFSLHNLMLVGLYFPIMQVSNYPSFTMRDAYLHAAPAKTILETGHLEYLGNLFPESWPASFDLHAIFSTVLGVDLINSNFLLYLALMISLILILYSYVRTLASKGYKSTWIGAVLFLPLLFNHLFDNFHHYSRTALAFVFLLFFFYLFIRFNNRRGSALLVVMVFAIVVTHPFQSVALVSFVLAYFVLETRLRSGMGRSIALLSVMIFLVCWFSLGYSTVFDALERLRAFYASSYVTPIVQTFSTRAPLPWWGSLLRDFFKYSLITMLAATGLAAGIALFKRKGHIRMVSYASSLLFSSVTMLFGLLFFQSWNLARFSAFAAFPAAFSSIILVQEVLKKVKIKEPLVLPKLLNGKAVLVILLVFVVSLSASVTTLRFERNHFFGEFSHREELTSLSWFFIHSQNSTVTIVSFRTMVYSTYFNYKQSDLLLELWYTELNKIGNNESMLLSSMDRLVARSQYVLRGMRDELDFGQVESPAKTLERFERAIISSGFTKVYDNGYYSTYYRGIP